MTVNLEEPGPKHFAYRFHYLSRRLLVDRAQLFLKDPSLANLTARRGHTVDSGTNSGHTTIRTTDRCQDRTLGDKKRNHRRAGIARSGHPGRKRTKKDSGHRRDSGHICRTDRTLGNRKRSRVVNGPWVETGGPGYFLMGRAGA